MQISPHPPQPKVALEVPGVRQMALEIAHHFDAPGECRTDETMSEYIARVSASMRLAATIAQVNPQAAAIIMAAFTSREAPPERK